jgi:tRNA-binding EMAP/Myf-like protein
VRKFGGEKALTKHTPVPDETLLKCHVTVEEDGKVNPIVSEVVNTNALAICGAHVTAVTPTPKGKLKVTLVRAKLSAVSDRLGKVMHKLYDLEPDHEPEKQLNIDLGVDLYQMEDY